MPKKIIRHFGRDRAIDYEGDSFVCWVRFKDLVALKDRKRVVDQLNTKKIRGQFEPSWCESKTLSLDFADSMIFDSFDGGGKEFIQILEQVIEKVSTFQSVDVVIYLDENLLSFSEDELECCWAIQKSRGEKRCAAVKAALCSKNEPLARLGSASAFHLLGTKHQGSLLDELTLGEGKKKERETIITSLRDSFYSTAFDFKKKPEKFRKSFLSLNHSVYLPAVDDSICQMVFYRSPYDAAELLVRSKKAEGRGEFHDALIQRLEQSSSGQIQMLLAEYSRLIGDDASALRLAKSAQTALSKGSKKDHFLESVLGRILQSLGELTDGASACVGDDRLFPISEIRSYGRSNFSVIGEVVEMGSVQSVKKKGKTLNFVEGRLKDKSGEILFILWEGDVQRVKTGMKIRVDDGWVGKKSMSNEYQLTLGKSGTLTVVGSSTERAGC